MTLLISQGVSLNPSYKVGIKRNKQQQTNLQFVRFCTKRNLHAVRYVAKRITSKFWVPKMQTQ